MVLVAKMTDRQHVIKRAHELRKWAEALGVFSQGRSTSGALRRDPGEPTTMFSAAGVNALVSKPITAIGYAASGRRDPRVFIYTRRKLTIAEQKGLADNKVDAPVEFRVAQPFSVMAPSTGTRFPAVYRGQRLACGSSISVSVLR